MSAKNKWFIGIGILAGLVVLFFLPSLWHTLYPVTGYGMIKGYGMHGFGFSPMFGGMGIGMFFMWLIPLGLLVLIGLAIAALVKYLKAPPSS